MTAFPQLLFWPNTIGFRTLSGTSNLSSFFSNSLTLDTHQLAWLFTCPMDCTPVAKRVHKIRFRIGASITTDADLEVRIETVGADGNPTGTLWSTTTNGVSAAPHAATTWYAVTLTSDPSINRGDKFAIVIKRSGAGTISLPIASGIDSAGLFQTTVYPRISFYNGTAWTKDDVGLNVGIELNDGTFINAGNMMHTGTLDTTSIISFLNSSTPNEYGNLFTATFTAKVVGMFARMKQNSGADGIFEFNLYDGSLSAPASALATAVSDDTSHLTNDYCTHMLFFPTAVWIKEGALYRACVYSTAASFGSSIEIFRVSANAHLVTAPGGAGCYKTSRTHAGPGTFTDVNTEQFGTIGLIIDEVISLRRHPGMSAGAAA